MDGVLTDGVLTGGLLADNTLTDARSREYTYVKCKM